MSNELNILKYKKALLSFVIASFAIFFFIPRGGKFKYEFNNGQPWAHENLVAPFDFPIYKTEAELLEERKNIAEQSLSYFVLDSLVGVKQLNILLNKVDSRQLSLELTKAFNAIYKRGILDNSDVKGDFLAIIRGNVYEKTPVGEIFTQTSAASYLKNTIRRYDYMSDTIVAYLSKLNVDQYFVPNLSLDKDLTSKIKQKSLDEILPTEGVVTEGTKIINNGEQINAETFKILSSLKRESERNTTNNSFSMLLGRLFFVLLCMGCIFVLLMTFRSTMLLETSCLVFVSALILFFTVVALQILKVQPSFIYAIPFTIVPIYISSFFYSRPAVYVHFFMVLLIGNFVPASFEFVFLNTIAGVTAIIGFKKSYERGQLFFIGLLIFVVYMLGYTSLKLLNEGNLSTFSWIIPVLFIINSLLVIILYQFTFLFERLFGFVSISRLVELADTNRKLLRDLSEVAPGTSQHVMQVANISEAIIRDIGGDTLLVRTGALYHDIGKLKNPTFFVENQASNISPHNSLPPEESARIIIEHVTYGIELAQKYRLPKIITDFIRTHHGKSKVFYFYSKYISNHQDDAEAAAKFTYPGLNPYTKEMVAVMMSDACEAASRSLPHPDEESINNLVDKIVDHQFKDGLYNESNITLKEINTAKSVIKYKLKNIYHARIEYPEKKD